MAASIINFNAFVLIPERMALQERSQMIYCVKSSILKQLINRSLVIIIRRNFMNKPMWIWYYGDFEIWQHMILSLRRDERGFFRPAPWGLDDCYHNVLFNKSYNLEKPEKINVYFDGIGYVSINGKMMGHKKNILLEKGENRLEIQIANSIGLPSLFIEGDTVISDESWLVTSYDSKYVTAGCWNLYDKLTPPSQFELPTKEIPFIRMEDKIDSLLIDAGTQTFSKVNLIFSGEGKACVHYGESLEEALSDNSYLFEDLCVNQKEYMLKARAFRYINIKFDGVKLQDIKLLFEFLPLEYKGKFLSSNEKLNKIWDLSTYTLYKLKRVFLRRYKTRSLCMVW